MSTNTIAITSRGLFDYQCMFDLPDGDLTAGSYLDCASGASSFGVQLRSRGGEALSVDPIYDQPVEEIERRVRRNLANSETWFAANDSAINWEFLGTHLAYCRATDAIVDLFVEDFRRNRSHYLAGSLPELPLADDSIDICLSANFLFAYAELIDAEQHAAAILELSRIARQRVLIHPANHRGGHDIAQLVGKVSELLSAADRVVQFTTPRHSWLKDATTMVVTKQEQTPICR